MKLDEKLWRMNAVPASNSEQLYDGRFPTLNAMKQKTNIEIQCGFLEEIKENRNRGVKEGDEYWKGDAWLYRTEMARRLDDRLVSFGKKSEPAMSQYQVEYSKRRLVLRPNKREQLNEKIVNEVNSFIDKGQTQEQAYQLLSENSKKLFGHELTPKAIEGRFKRTNNNPRKTDY